MRIVIQRADGGLTIRNPAPKDRRPGETEEQFLQRLERQNLAPGETVVGRTSTLPDVPVKVWEYEDGDPVLKDRSPRAARNAWVWRNRRVEVDADKEKEVLMEPMRAVRNRMLDDSDIAMTKALEAEDRQEQQRLRTYRQALRDLPQNTQHPKDAVFPERPDSVKPRGKVSVPRPQ